MPGPQVKYRYRQPEMLQLPPVRGCHSWQWWHSLWQNWHEKKLRASWILVIRCLSRARTHSSSALGQLLGIQSTQKSASSSCPKVLDRVDEQKACHCDFSSRRGPIRKATVRRRFGSTAGFRGRVGQCRLAEDCRYVRFHCTSCNPEVLDNFSVTDPRLSREPTPHVRAKWDQRDRGLWTRITLRGFEGSLMRIIVASALELNSISQHLTNEKPVALRVPRYSWMRTRKENQGRRKNQWNGWMKKSCRVKNVIKR